MATVLFTLQCTAAPSCSAGSAILMDGDTGAVLYEKNADAQSLIASTTKIMTAVVVLEQCDPESVYVIPAEATGIEGSSLYLKEGEELTICELLYGLMLHSGNDAAVALALACSDSVPEFVSLMNLKAQELELHDTHFENPSGLDGQQHYSSARDLAKLTRFALNIPAFREIVSTKSICIGERRLTNHNKLLWSLDGAIGVKTGYTRAAGRILVSAAERNGRRLIAVTINDGNDWKDHESLYTFGFGQYEERSLLTVGSETVCIPLLSGGTARLLAGEDFSFFVRDEENVNVRLLYPKLAFETGPEGSFAGYGVVYLGEKQIGRIQLLWGGRP